jgi:hypothetical protein
MVTTHPSHQPSEKVTGRIVRLDVPARQLTLQVGHRTLELAVTPRCAVELHGEPVRLRLLQVGDRVSVMLEGEAVPMATAIRVEPPWQRATEAN